MKNVRMEFDDKTMRNNKESEPDSCCDDLNCQTECIDWDMIDELVHPLKGVVVNNEGE